MLGRGAAQEHLSFPRPHWIQEYGEYLEADSGLAFLLPFSVGKPTTPLGVGREDIIIPILLMWKQRPVEGKRRTRSWSQVYKWRGQA